MSICLIVQKDTLENNKVKSIVRIASSELGQFLDELQSNHCIEYQLLCSTSVSEELEKNTKTLIAPFKTNYGKDWYEFDHDILAKIITLFLENDHCYLDLKCILSIIGFSLTMFPVVNKEIRISSVSNGSSNSSSNSSSNASSNKKTNQNVSEIKERVNQPCEIKEELVTVLENLEKTDKRKKDKEKDKEKDKNRNKKL